MIRREPTPTRSVPDAELGIAAMLLLIAVLLTVIIVPVLG